ncbi:TIGR00730 family Rossman fold protein [Niveispirillum sp. SYP-B3756]|uniref:LOG family protein n=1 Tax=Niveispirillum sp. SYP-B3756 TaxID=2662178 RepID=UPI001291C479|nr:TIGR00730 family Rossman fold protein [Niveispirillum sp. SYP-B3756]MQP64805.1 TIGR00730 family Rossman fold protein [Niveispirillum sp. SYP-B3756]
MSNIRSVCVYCGSSNYVDEAYKQAAKQTGHLLAAAGLDLVYGGGNVGLMGITADAALAAGGRVIGIIPDHIQKFEVDHTGLTELHVVDSMHTRKRMMVERSDAFIVLPGGIGTLDEMFEIITWRQLQLHAKPVIIVNINGFWDPLLALMDHMQATGFMRKPNLPGASSQLFQIVNDVESILPLLSVQPTPMREAQTARI